MHELSLADAIISAVLRMSEEEKWGKVEKIHLRIGFLRQVFPDMLSFAFESISKNTSLEGVSLIVEDVPLEWMCTECENRWIEDVALCPLCSSFNRKMLSGMELEIYSVEVESG